MGSETRRNTPSKRQQKLCRRNDILMGNVWIIVGDYGNRKTKIKRIQLGRKPSTEGSQNIWYCVHIDFESYRWYWLNEVHRPFNVESLSSLGIEVLLLSSIRPNHMRWFRFIVNTIHEQYKIAEIGGFCEGLESFCTPGRLPRAFWLLTQMKRMNDPIGSVKGIEICSFQLWYDLPKTPENTNKTLHTANISYKRHTYNIFKRILWIKE